MPFRRPLVIKIFLFAILICFFSSSADATVKQIFTASGPAIIVEAGDGQAILAHGTTKEIALKLVDENGRPLVGESIKLTIFNRPAKAAKFVLPIKSVITDPVGIARFQLEKVEHPGQYQILSSWEKNTEVTTSITLIVNEESWVMYLVFGLFGGLGMFLFGMGLGADGLQKIAGKKMKGILGTFTNNRYMGVLTGILVTAVTQSSSATTVMLVGFVNASLMTISQTLSVIFGANIGTTITVQLIAFEISHFALLMIGIGFILKYSRKKTVYYAGDIILGFGFIFYGMKVMSTSMSPLRSFPAFKEMLIAFSDYPVTAIIGSMLFTALIQSSGATIGLVVVFASQGLITLHASIPLILGAHTGTCITGWIAAIGGSAAAKKTALLNILYNVIGTIVFLPFIYDYMRFSDFVIWCTRPFSSSAAREVANAHMISAFIKMFVMFPFYDRIVWLTHLVIPEETNDEHNRSVKTKYLSEGLLKSPELALGNVAREISRMAGHVEYMMDKVPGLISYGEEEIINEVLFRESKVDTAQYEITKYLSNLSEESLTEEQTATMMKYMTIINDLEGLGDLITKVIIPFARAKAREQVRFSEEGFRELLNMFDRSNENFMLVINAFATNNKVVAERVMNSERTFDVLIKRLRTSHMRRVFQNKVQSIETSTLHMDLLQCFKRINGHSIEIAKAMIGDWFSLRAPSGKPSENEKNADEENTESVIVTQEPQKVESEEGGGVEAEPVKNSEQENPERESSEDDSSKKLPVIDQKKKS